MHKGIRKAKQKTLAAGTVNKAEMVYNGVEKAFSARNEVLWKYIAQF